MVDYLYHHNANTHWVYPTSAETDALLGGAREAAADLLNAGRDEIAFGNNMTTLTFHVSRALGRRWGAGDEVIVTELDHHANVAPWREMARDRGVTVRTVRMDPAQRHARLDDLRRAFTPRTRLLAIGAASNALGTINDVAAATRLAHEHGALSFVDAVHYAAHGVVDVKAWDCDFLACSSYKFYGPHVGILYGKPRAHRRARRPAARTRVPTSRRSASRRGRSTTRGSSALARPWTSSPRSPPVPPAARTPNELAGRAARARRRARRATVAWALRHRWRDALRCGPRAAPRTPTVIFTVAGMTSTEVARALVPHGSMSPTVISTP